MNEAIPLILLKTSSFPVQWTQTEGGGRLRERFREKDERKMGKREGER